jgi:hypothetical protein
MYIMGGGGATRNEEIVTKIVYSRKDKCLQHFVLKANFHHYTSKENSSATHRKDFLGGKNEPKSPDF